MFWRCQGLWLPVQDAHSGQGWESAVVEVPVTAAAAAAPASGSPAPTDCGSSSIAPVQLVCSPVLSGSSTCTALLEEQHALCHVMALFAYIAISLMLHLQDR